MELHIHHSEAASEILLQVIMLTLKDTDTNSADSKSGAGEYSLGATYTTKCPDAPNRK